MPHMIADTTVESAATEPRQEDVGQEYRVLLFIFLTAIFVTCFPVLDVSAEPPQPEPPAIDFARDIEPIFKQHCVSCHGPSKQESDFRVDVRNKLLQGGDYGEPAVVPGKSDAGLLVKFVRGDDPDSVMPPEGDRLSDKQVALLRAWIDQGATMPASEVAKLTTDHWSFQPLRQDEGGRLAAEGRNPIDVLIDERLAERGLARSKKANRVTLIRRLYLVMHGLPPTPEQVAEFVVDESDDSYEHLVAEVLNSPRYGERWAQHWLDLVRFGETHGFETNRERPNAWHYRDYVIRALNDDKPYDEFIKEQIAGDALGADVATGFLVAGPYDLVKGQDPMLALVQRQDELADMINTTGTAFLGLTLGCARCHSHKFDPITQRDYYSIQAVFAGVQHADRALPRSAADDKKLAAAKARVAQAQADLADWMSAQGFRIAVNHLHNVDNFTPTPAKFVRFTVESTSSSQPCIDELEIFADGKNVALASLGAKARCSTTLPGYDIHKLEHINDGKYGNSHSWISNESGAGWVEIELPTVTTIDRIEWARDRTGQYKDRVATNYKIEVAAKAEAWKLVSSSDDRLPYSTNDSIPFDKLAELAGDEITNGKQLFDAVTAAKQERDQLSKSSQIYAGNFVQPGATHRLYRGDPTAKREEVAPDALEVLGSLGLDTTTPEQQRRLAFAEWVASDSNPLTARVLVNRIWQHHFGTGLVDTPSDFGANGTKPSHPELLDWLAAEFMHNGWSIKHIHRLILLSNTFQQSNAPDATAMQVDAASRLLWRFPPRRIEAEAVRDCVLAVSGALDLTMGGPGFSGFEVEMENVRHYHPKETFGPEDWRRMIYMTKVRQERDAVFGAFDCPDLSQVTPKRSRSTTPLQALSLFNSNFMLQQAELLAKRLQESDDNREGQLKRAFQLCFSRDPHSVELSDAEALAKGNGLIAVCRALLNSNEFLFIP